MADESGKGKQMGMAGLALVLIIAAGVLVMWNFEVGPFKKKPVVDVDPTTLLTAEEKALAEKDKARMEQINKVITPSGS